MCAHLLLYQCEYVLVMAVVFAKNHVYIKINEPEPFLFYVKFIRRALVLAVML